MITIRQIAELSGISRGTVDRVLNNRGGVNQSTAAKVVAIAQTLNYTPNRAGIALAARKKNFKIGFILAGGGNPFFDEVVEGINQKALELDAYGVTVITKRVKGFSVQTQLAAIEELVREGINGLAITPVNHPAIVAQVNLLSQQGIPVVTSNTDLDGSKRLAYVGSDYYQSGKSGGRLMELITGGRANIGIVTGSGDVLCHSKRIEGFRSVVGEQEEMRILETVENGDDEFVSFSVTKELLLRCPQLNALFLCAAGVNGACKAVQELGRAGGIKIISFDRTPATRQLVLDGVISASICQQPFKQGSKPIDFLFTYLLSGIPPEKEFFYTSIDIRIKENVEQE